MITVTIGTEQRSLQDVTPDWINQQMQRRHADGQSICVRVLIRQGAIDMALSTAGCPASGGGGGRPLRPPEIEIFDLWDERKLSGPQFSGGSLVAFLSQLRRSFG